MIQLDNIKKVFQTEEVETWALRNISLQAVSYTHLTLPTSDLV